jgi:hypothetical protein
MTASWVARKMIPGRDTVSVMAMHYGLRPNQVRDVIKEAGVEVIREDGFKGTLVKKSRGTAWSDGQVGFDPETTKLTRTAIMTVARWKIEKDTVAA